MCRDDGAKRLAVASTLLSRGDVNFDRKTRTSTVADLLADMDSASMLTYVRSLAEAASDNGEGGLDRRLWAVDALYALSKHPTVSGDAAMTLVVLRLLLALAYFDASGVAGSAEAAAGKKEKKKDKRRSSKGGDAADWILVRSSVPKVRRRF
jgi:hypothetical protein